MSNSIFQEKLKEYQVTTFEQEVNAVKEIIQEIILYGLSTTNFFERALFQGGTSLRILYGLQRFSEDLDFILKGYDPHFNWKFYIESIKSICEEYGVVAIFTDKSKANASIQKMFVKNDSVGKILELSFKNRSLPSMMIKLEIDVNPPLGSKAETKYLDFPLIYAVEAQDLASNFSCKCHALLCRPYLKGRDWYDFLWYVSKKTIPNMPLLQNAIFQAGSWKDQKIDISPPWLIEMLKEQINNTNWDKAKSDVERFLSERDKQSLSLWNSTLFLDRVKKLEDYMKHPD